MKKLILQILYSGFDQDDLFRGKSLLGGSECIKEDDELIID